MLSFIVEPIFAIVMGLLLIIISFFIFGYCDRKSLHLGYSKTGNLLSLACTILACGMLYLGVGIVAFLGEMILKQNAG